MNKSEYEKNNSVKTSFDACYIAPTPHQYFHNMSAVGYRMGEYMNPFLAALVEASVLPPRLVRVLDLGCSYGVSGALLKTDCSYQDLVEFVHRETSSDYSSCAADVRRYLELHPAREDVEVLGIDSSAEAVRFATASGMIDEGIACNLEDHKVELTKNERNLLRRCDVFLSTGVIGYVTDTSVSRILDDFGHDARGQLGPLAIMSVLELFDPTAIATAFSKHGYRFGQLPVRLPQRYFADEQEREGVLKAIRDRGESTAVQESEGQMFASLYIASYPESFDVLTKKVIEVAEA